MKKVTITNAYTWYNKGDAGILLGIVETLKKIYKKEIEVTVLSFTPEEDKKRYCQDNVIQNVYSNVLNPHPYQHTKIGKIFAIIKLFFQMIYQFMLIHINPQRLVKKYENYHALSECDYIIVCGGGFLGGKKFDSFMHLFQIYINTKFNKKTIVMGTSIEPIGNQIIKKMTERILKKVDFIIARETITFHYLKEFMPLEKIDLVPDMAFMLEDKIRIDKKIKKQKETYGNIYGLTVRAWNFPNTKNPTLQMNNYMNAIVEVISNHARTNNDLFIFVPQVMVAHGNDAEVAKKIQKLLPADIHDHFIIIEDDLSPVEIKSLIGNMDYFIGTRMHSNIFATSMKIPTIAIAYEKKTNGIMETVGLSNFVVEIDDITAEKLQKKIDNCIENRKQIVQLLEKEIPLIRQKIQTKIEKIVGEEENK
ncbi:MAG: polysaccharide pyruvyl transferase family protein [bacterium]|nr:polysaccharide pyruvyl transferase family protein [bacterium]